MQQIETRILGLLKMFAVVLLHLKMSCYYPFPEKDKIEIKNLICTYYVRIDWIGSNPKPTMYHILPTNTIHPHLSLLLITKQPKWYSQICTFINLPKPQWRLFMYCNLMLGFQNSNYSPDHKRSLPNKKNLCASNNFN